MLTQFDELLKDPIEKFYFTGTFLTIANIIISIFLFLKAEWISRKLIVREIEISTELNPKSLSKVILLTVAIVWLAESIYLFPDFIDYCLILIAKFNGDANVNSTNFSAAKYILRIIIAVSLVSKIEKISEWIIRKI